MSFFVWLFRINLVTLTPLCENMPGPSANKPGDVYVFECLFRFVLVRLIDLCFVVSML